MATQRYISTSFWTDKWIRGLDPSERYLYIYLLTNPETNIAGVYQITIDRIAFDTGYDERTLRPMFERFAKAGKAYFYNEEWIIIPSWPRHQKVGARDRVKKGIDAILLDLPEDVWQFLVSKGYDYKYLEDIGRPIKGAYKGSKGASMPHQWGSNYSDSDTDLNLTRTTSAQGAGSAEASENPGEEDPFDDIPEKAPPEVPEHIQSINDTLFSTFGRFMSGEEVDLAKELVKKHYPGRVSKELRKVAKNREPPKAPVHYIHSYLKDQETRSNGKKQVATPVNADDLEEVEF